MEESTGSDSAPPPDVRRVTLVNGGVEVDIERNSQRLATSVEAAGTSRYTDGVLTCREFDAAHDEEFFASLPASPAVFVLRAKVSGGEPYVSKTANLRRRLERLLGSAKDAAGNAIPSRRLNLRERVRAVELCEVGGDFEAGFALYRLLRAEFPSRYAERLHLRPAPLLQLLRDNAYPRVAVSSRIRSLRAGGEYFGPFASRAEAEQYANDSLDFFLLRRCTDELKPDPSFPGCVYSEMKMCLAPCFKGCSDERYAEEAARVDRYLESGGHSLLVEIGRARDEASERLEFEAAAAAHARLEKLKAVHSRLAEIVHRIDRLNALLLQPSHLPGHIALFRIAAGMLHGPIAFDLSARGLRPEMMAEQDSAAERASSQSMEARIKALLRTVEAARPSSAQEWMEHLAILKRWYYRTNKVGEIFFEDEHGALPMRRVVRAVGRVLKGEKPAGDLSETAGDYWAYRAKDAGL
jgi:excinuclease ABC subunit C